MRIILFTKKLVSIKITFYDKIYEKNADPDYPKIKLIDLPLRVSIEFSASRREILSHRSRDS